MNRIPVALLPVALALASVTCAQLPETRTLGPVAVDATAWRPGRDVSGDVPGRAFEITVGKDRLLLWDLNADGRLTTDGRDGLSTRRGPFIVALPETVLLTAGQVRWAFPSLERAELGTESVDLPFELISAAAAVTFFRLGAGLPPMLLDVEASEHCALHCDYLRQNPPTLYDLSVHDEVKGRPGYTEEGERAGAQSVIFRGPGVEPAVRWCAATVWHAVPLLYPERRRFGVAHRHGFVVLWARGSRHLDRHLPYPADGAADVAVAFGIGSGEVPNPVLGTSFAQGCGQPVFVMLKDGFDKRLRQATLTDAEGGAVVGTQSCPRAPANPAWPSNSGCALFVPAKPLAHGTRYSAHFAFDGGAVVEWSFTTEPEQRRFGKGSRLPDPSRYKPKKGHR